MEMDPVIRIQIMGEAICISQERHESNYSPPPQLLANNKTNLCL